MYDHSIFRYRYSACDFGLSPSFVSDQVVDLHAHLKALGLRKTGLKEELVQRLYSGLSSVAGEERQRLQQPPPEEPGGTSDGGIAKPARRNAKPQASVSGAAEEPLRSAMAAEGEPGLVNSRSGSQQPVESTGSSASSASDKEPQPQRQRKVQDDLTDEDFMAFVKRASETQLPEGVVDPEQSPSEGVPPGSRPVYVGMAEVRRREERRQMTRRPAAPPPPPPVEPAGASALPSDKDDQLGAVVKTASGARLPRSVLERMESWRRNKAVEAAAERRQAQEREVAAELTRQKRDRTDGSRVVDDRPTLPTPREALTPAGATAKPRTLKPLDRPRSLRNGDEFSGDDGDEGSGSEDWLPRSGHPQEQPGQSWAGHRDPGFSSAGRAVDVVFGSVAAGPASRNGRPLPGAQAPLLQVEKNGYISGEIDERRASELRAQPLPLPPGLPPLPPAYRGESYGTHQLHMSWEDKEVRCTI